MCLFGPLGMFWFFHYLFSHTHSLITKYTRNRNGITSICHWRNRDRMETKKQKRVIHAPVPRTYNCLYLECLCSFFVLSLFLILFISLHTWYSIRCLIPFVFRSVCVFFLGFLALLTSLSFENERWKIQSKNSTAQQKRQSFPSLSKICFCICCEWITFFFIKTKSMNKRDKN